MKVLTLLAAITLSCSCNVKEHKDTVAQKSSMGFLNVRTEFFDGTGKLIFMDSMKVWYYDSVAIEELATIKSVTDTLQRTTVSFIIDGYRYINLKTKSWGLYKNFTDTSRLIRSGALPDTVFLDGGWTFYVNNLPMQGEPEILPDTVIKSIKYKRIKFSRIKRGPASYVIGYLRCDKNNVKLFSLEKAYSNKVNCVMARFNEFREGESRPFAFRELEFLSDTLSDKELKVFAAWENNQRHNPVH
jgi:hypothetical protein